MARTNDDYCDCEDGSDEPGTSACANGRFYCVNKGHRGEHIFSSRVNDGICDCCDGSDETGGKVKCVDICLKVGEAAKKEEAEYEKIFGEGAEIRKKYIQQYREGMEAKREELVSVSAEIETLRGKLAAVQAVKEKAVSEEKVKREEVEALKKAQELEQKADDWVASLDEPTTDSTNPSTQSTNPSTQPTEPIDESSDSDEVNDEFHDEDEQYQHEHDDDEEPDDDHEIENEHTEEVEHTRDEVIHRHHHKDMKIETRRPHEDKKKEEDDPELKPFVEAKQKAEGDYNEVKRQFDDLEKREKEIKETLGQDYGREGEFYPLSLKCFALQTKEYKYEVCPFNNVNQAHTDLGRWKHWENNYSVQLYDDGLQCWQGPRRSTRVVVSCGRIDEVLSVSEPAKCEYQIKFSTPAACSDATFPPEL